MAAKSIDLPSDIAMSPEHRIVYSQVQQFSVSDTEVAISFLRNQPDLAVTKGQLSTVGSHWINEATVYVPIAQAQALCTVLAKTLDQHQAKKQPQH